MRAYISSLFSCIFVVGVLLMPAAGFRLKTTSSGSLLDIHSRRISKLKGIEDFYTYDTSLSRQRAPRQAASMYEINRKYRLHPYTIEKMMRPNAVGFAGVILSLDTFLLDLSNPVCYALGIIAGELEKPITSPDAVIDLLGCSFSEFSTGLAWGLPARDLPKHERRFYEILDMVLSQVPLQPRDGVEPFLAQLLQEGNEVVVLTSLTIDLALKVLGKSQLSRIFEGKVSPDRLLCRELMPNSPVDDEDMDYDDDNSDIDDDDNAYDADADGENLFYESQGDGIHSTYSGSVNNNKRFIKCCSLLKKPPIACVLVDGSRGNMMEAKRNSISCIGISGE